MLRLLRLLFVSLVRSFCSRRDLLLENLSLRQQLAVLKAEASTIEVQGSGQALLDSPEPPLARLGAGPDSRAARDGRSLAPRRI
jgi:hypothetical protein